MFVLQTLFISSHLAEPWQVRGEGEGVTECVRVGEAVGSIIDCVSLFPPVIFAVFPLSLCMNLLHHSHHGQVGRNTGNSARCEEVINSGGLGSGKVCPPATPARHRQNQT